MGTKFLLVDDEPHNLQILITNLMIHNESYEFMQALNSSDALYIAEKQSPDIIITDWQMPGGDGISLIRNLKQNKKTKDIPIIMSTGVMRSNEHLKIALDAGAIDYIRKPIEPIELIARTDSVLLLAKYHKENIKSKNRELAASALQIAQQIQFQNKIHDKVAEIEVLLSNPSKEVKQLLHEIIEELNYKTNNSGWANFNEYFQEVHTNFNKGLLARYPKLSPAELRLCAFIKLGMSTKEISGVTFNSPDSIRVARTRLRKKLNLHNEENLTSFLSTF